MNKTTNLCSNYIITEDTRPTAVEVDMKSRIPVATSRKVHRFWDRHASRLFDRIGLFQCDVGYSLSRGFCSGKSTVELTHLDKDGKATMVDVSGKEMTKREAVAKCRVYLGEKVFNAIRNNETRKGNALEIARIAGINGAKQTSFLIPLCHNIPLSNVSVDFEMDEEQHFVTVTGKASCIGRTGVEMEALMAVTLSALTIYDMCKSISHEMIIGDVKLMKKLGGKSDFNKLNK